MVQRLLPGLVAALMVAAPAGAAETRALARAALAEPDGTFALSGDRVLIAQGGEVVGFPADGGPTETVYTAPKGSAVIQLSASAERVAFIVAGKRAAERYI